MRHPKARHLASKTALAAALISSACIPLLIQASTSSASTSKSPFVVLNIEGVSGADSATTAAYAAGFNASEAYLNAHGGILGHKVKVVTVNDNSDPTTAISDLDAYLSNHPKPNVVFPGSADQEGAALLPVLAKDGILSFHGSALSAYGIHSQTPEAYTLLGPTDGQAQAEVNYIKSKGYTSVGILSEGISFTQEETGPLLSALGKAGISFNVQSFPASALDVTSEMQALKASSPQAVIVEALFGSAGYALTARATLGWSVPIIGDPAFGDSNVQSLVPASDITNVVANIFNCNEYLAPSARPVGLKTFLQYASKYITGVVASVPMNLTATGWDGLLLMQKAAKQAGSIKTSSMVKALNNLKSPGNPLYVVFHKISYTAQNHANVNTSASDYAIVPVGPIVGGFVTPTS